jgi:hypothetical protein
LGALGQVCTWIRIVQWIVAVVGNGVRVGEIEWPRAIGDHVLNLWLWLLASWHCE